MRIIIAACAVLITTASCNKKSTPINLLRPAEVTLPSEVNTMVTIDRSRPASGFWNVVEGLFTGEEIGQDREGRRRAIESLRVNLTRTPRFKVIHSGVELSGSRSGSRFPEPLAWDIVRDYCRKYQADVLVALELFDSDTPMAVRSERKKDAEGNEYKEFIVDQTVIIRTGWRVYEPKTQTILDEHVSTAQRIFSSRGLDSMQVVSARRWQLEDVRAIAGLAGMEYTKRIAPIWIIENRQIYRKGKDKRFHSQFDQANEWIKIGRWDMTIPIYKSIVQNASDPVTAGRAAFNLAVAYEQTENFSQAIEWTEIAHIRYKIRPARDYHARLLRRQNDELLLDHQFK